MAIQRFTGRIQQRFSTLAVITAANPILLEGEVWTEKDASTGRSTGRRKVGDGVIGAGDVITGTAFNSLPFEPTAGGGSGDVVGPASATDGRAALFDGATGKLLKVASAAPVLEGDARLSDAREWTAATIEQAEAEAGTATTRRAFTAQRVFQAVAAWWASSAAATKLSGIATGATANSSDATLLARANHTGTQAAGTITGLAAVATSGAYSSLSGLPTLPTGGDAFRYFGAAEFIPRTTNGCGVNSDETTTNRVNRDLLMFDAGTQEFAQVWFAWPTGWNTFSATFLWKYSSGSGNCVWGAQARLYADNTAVDTAFGTAQTVTDNGQGTAIHHESTATSAITPGGTVADGRLFVLQIYRDATNGSDTLSVDAELIGVILTKVT
jgi:hypothetical protein